MKNIYTLLCILCCFHYATGQNIPIDFEATGNGSDWSWRTFENDTDPTLEIVANPDTTGINSSAAVAKFTALQTGQAFAGCESLHGADIGSFTIDATNAVIRIMVWKSVISDVGIKLVRADNWSLGEIKTANTLTNQWEQLSFDFSSHIGNTYDQIVIFPDFDIRQTDNIIYFDNIYGEAAMTSSTIQPSASDIKIYPNPVHNTIHIEADNEIVSYEIYTITGALIDSHNNLDNNTIVVNSLESGHYFIKTMSLQGTTTTLRFYKE